MMDWRDLIPFIGFERLPVDEYGEPSRFDSLRKRWFFTMAWFGMGISIGLK
jgi:hypothetical protein